MKFKIGDKVILKKGTPLYKSSNATNYSSKLTSDKITNITRIAQGSKHPYNTTGDLGWCDESYITLYKEDEKKYEGELTLIDLNGLVDYVMAHDDKVIILDSKQLKKLLKE